MHRHFIVHKPYGFLSQFVFNSGNKKKKLLGDLYEVPQGTMAIGRLDEPSEGLLFLTTDGKESERVRSKKVEKEYFVQVDGVITQNAIDDLQKPIKINVKGEFYTTRPAKVKVISQPEALPHRSKDIRDDRHGPTSWISVTLTEGKFRQIRKICASVHFPVLRLIRVRIGNTFLSDVVNEGIKEVDRFDV